MTKMSQFAGRCRQLLFWGTVALAIGGTSALAQSAGTAKPASANTSDDYGYAKWDITPFVGWQWFQAFQGNNQRNYTDRFESGPIFGLHFGVDATSHVGLEASLMQGRNRLDLRPYGQTTFASIVTWNTTLSADLLYHFQPRTRNTRLFIFGGPAVVWYEPRGTGSSGAQGNFAQPQSQPQVKAEPAVNYGIGVKHYINDRYGLRFQVGGRLGPASHFGLPSAQSGPNSIYIPTGGKFSSLDVSLGLIIREGWVAPPPPPNPLVSQALRVDVPAGPGGAPSISGAHDVCPGDDLRLTINANGFPNPTYQWRINGAPAAGATGATFSAPTATGTGARAVTAVVSSGASVGTSAPFATSSGHTYHLTAEPQGLGGRAPAYQWMVNGQPVAGATSSSYDLPDSGSASVTVRVTVQNPPVTSAAANFTISALTPPTLTFAITPNTVPYTSGPITLRAVATASSCGGAVTVRYSGESVTGTSFNPGGVSGFDMGNRLRQQTKTVTITATASTAVG